MIEQWKRWARQLKSLIAALVIACRDPRTPWLARVVALCVVGYAFSPIDLIPDPIPVLGYLDDLILLPLGIALAVKLIPDDVWAEARALASSAEWADRPVNRIAAGVIVAVWLVTFAAITMLVWNRL